MSGKNFNSVCLSLSFIIRYWRIHGRTKFKRKEFKANDKGSHRTLQEGGRKQGSKNSKLRGPQNISNWMDWEKKVRVSRQWWEKKDIAEDCTECPWAITCCWAAALLSKCWFLSYPAPTGSLAFGSHFSATWENNFTEHRLKQFHRLTLTVRIALYRSFLFHFLSSSHRSFLYLPKEYFNFSFHHIYLLSRGHCFKPHSPKYHQQKVSQGRLLKNIYVTTPFSVYLSKSSEILTHCREYLTWPWNKKRIKTPYI